MNYPEFPEFYGPYFEVRWHKVQILPAGARFGIPYNESETHQRVVLLKGKTVEADPMAFAW